MAAKKEKSLASVSTSSAPVSSQTADAFRRWGHLQADLDYFGRIEKISHRDLEQSNEAEAPAFRKTYCSAIGAEFMHMYQSDRTDWVASKMEEAPSKVDQKFIF